MSPESIKLAWSENFRTAPQQLNKMAEVKGLVSAFNANIDAVIKISGKEINRILKQENISAESVLQPGERNIQCPSDALRGLIHCFRNGIAEEWLINDVSVFNWLHQKLGYDKLQMGGQGGIVANVMAVCKVNPVYVHCASLPADQAGLFLDLQNLLSTDENGQLRQAVTIDRKTDIPLIHWIIEFDVNDTIELENTAITCPKSNRFIATFDPLNFKLHIDTGFTRAVSQEAGHLDFVILSGYQMLREKLDEQLTGAARIEASLEVFEDWRSRFPSALFHLEMASTQDKVMRKYLLDHLAPKVDSLGFNERELIDLLEVMDENELAGQCNQKSNSVNLFKAMEKVKEYTGCRRLQLHMFGLYLTIQDPGFRISPLQNRNGMQLASVIAAAKAGTGAINDYNILLWAQDKTISDTGVRELSSLADYLSDSCDPRTFAQTGIAQCGSTDIIAVPTILIDKPITLVGMGDTISSISLVAAR